MTPGAKPLAAANELIQQATAELGWPELGPLLKIKEQPGFAIWHVPGLAEKSLGAAPSAPPIAMLGVLTAAFKMVDCLLDGERPPPWAEQSPGHLANSAQAATATALHLTGRLAGADHSGLKLRQRCEAMIAEFCRAQSTSVQPPLEETAYWRLVDGTTGRLFRFGLLLGADSVEGIESADWQDRLAPLASSLARLLQINDDLTDAIKTPEEPDWSGRSLNLAILYARTMPHAGRDEFNARMEEGSALQVSDRMIEMLFSSGAISFCTACFLAEYRVALDRLRGAGLPDPGPFESTFQGLLSPAIFFLREAAGDEASAILERELPAVQFERL